MSKGSKVEVRYEVGAPGLGAAAGPVEGGCLSGRQRAGHVAVGRSRCVESWILQVRSGL